MIFLNRMNQNLSFFLVNLFQKLSDTNKRWNSDALNTFKTSPLKTLNTSIKHSIKKFIEEDNSNSAIIFTATLLHSVLAGVWLCDSAHPHLDPLYTSLKVNTSSLYLWPGQQPIISCGRNTDKPLLSALVRASAMTSQNLKALRPQYFRCSWPQVLNFNIGL